MKKNLLIFVFLFICKATFSQSSNVSLASKWLHGPDGFNAVYSSGNYVYCAADSVLTILDVSNPSMVKGVSQVITGSKINWIYVVNSKAYIAQGDSGLCIVDVSNPYLPLKMGTCDSIGNALSVKVLGNYAYVASGSNGMRIIDVSNSNAPVEISFFNTGNGSANVVDVSGSYAYIAYGNAGLRIVDISNPLTPVASAVLNSGTTMNVFIQNNYAYLVVNNDVNIVNISNASMPVVEGTIFQVNFNFGLFVSGNYAFGSNGDWFEIWDISNSFVPTYVSTFNDYSWGSGTMGSQQMAVNGNISYCLKFPLDGTFNQFAGLDVVDVNNPSMPALLIRFSQPQISTGICTSGNYVYSGGWTPPGSELITILDVTNPNHPQQLGTFVDTLNFDFGGAFSIVSSGNYIYLSGTKVTQSAYGFKIIDVSNPLNPVKAGTYSINNTTVNGGIAVKGNYAYVCYYSLGLVVVDVSNAALPVQVGSVILTGGFQAVDVFISGHYAYIIDNGTKMHVVDISNPTVPIEVGSFQLAGTGSDIYADGNYVYVAEGALGFQIINAGNPSSPVLAGAYTAVSNHPLLQIYKHGNFIYLADPLNGMQVIDVSNPASPTQAGYYYDTGILARNVYADSLHSYLAADEGLYIFNGTALTSTNFKAEDIVELSVTPNPFEYRVTFSIEKQTVKTVSYSVKSMQGKILSIGQESKINYPYTQTINLSSLAKGVYFLDVIIDGKRIVKKIVKG